MKVLSTTVWAFATLRQQQPIRGRVRCFASKSSQPNRLLEETTLRNSFVALRHGQSQANVQQLIASKPEVARDNYGLSSPVGWDQAKAAGQDLVRMFDDSRAGVCIVTSDLLRARQTAETVGQAVQEAGLPLWNNEICTIDTRLRERDFGQWDLTSDEHYHDVWKEDALDASHTQNSVESVHSVMGRVTECVLDWDAQLQDHLIVLVAHGDVLQILQTAFAKMDGSLHRTMEHLETATLRPLQLDDEQSG